MNNVALRIACCIERARIESSCGHFPDWSVHTYWHTREAAQPYARELGVSFTQVIPALKRAESFVQSKVYELSEPFWSDLAHPLFILKEVMES
jgi:hypothetical protein